MCRQPALSPSERERIYQGQVQGKSIPEIASELGRSGHVVRKWWRRIRQEGLAGLRDRRPGPAPRGILGRFDTRVRRAALRLKQTHPRWGPNRVLLALRQAPELDGVRLPHRSRLATFFKHHCPECVARQAARPPTPPAPPRATAVHEVWELDAQEKILLGDGGIATVCTLRDPVGAAIIASQAFETRTAKHWRKLAWMSCRPCRWPTCANCCRP